MVLITAILELCGKVSLWLSGYRPNDDLGSCVRRGFSHFTVALIIVYCAEAVYVLSGPNAEGLDVLTIQLGIVWSFLFFVNVVVIPAIFLVGQRIELNPKRLLFDIAISGAFSVVAFALIYRKVGILPGANDMQLLPVLDTIYFSAVTFSTLGFGDFRPAADVRVYAAIQGLWGNIHLGLLAGTVFYAIQTAEQSR